LKYFVQDPEQLVVSKPDPDAGTLPELLTVPSSVDAL
jgi:hypothetical protein